MAEFPQTKAMRAFMASIGRKGGKARAKNLTASERSAIASKAGSAPKRSRRRASELEAVNS